MLDSLRSVLRFRRFELDGNKRRLATAANVHDLRRIAKRRLPAGVFDYIDGGAEDERTMRRQLRSVRPAAGSGRVCCATCRRSTRPRRCWARALPIPLVLAPTGFTRIADPAGELAVASAARRANLPYTLSTLSTRSIEEVAAANGDGRRWFQVYVWKDRALLRDMIERAAAAGYEALVVTVDTANLGRRERDVRRGFDAAAEARLGHDPRRHRPSVMDLAFRPLGTDPIRQRGDLAVGQRTARRQRRPFSSSTRSPPNSTPACRGRRSSGSARCGTARSSSRASSPSTTHSVAADVGVEAIALSNHGGRQLDDAPAALDLVAPVADEVGGRVEIICDGGVRRGSDLVKAVALGATACMAGRAYLYGLAAAGEAGVDAVLQLLADDVRRTMALIGVSNVAELSREYIDPCALSGSTDASVASPRHMLDTLRSVLRFRRFQLDSNKRRLATAANVDDLRRIAKRRLPAGVFDYIDGGAEDEVAMRANRDAYSSYEFSPRVLRDVSTVDTRSTLLGSAVPIPVVLAPTGYTRIADPQGELAVARAAQRAGVPYTLSTMATRSIEEVAAANRDRPPLVPGLRLEGSRPGRATWSSARRRPGTRRS